MSGDTVVVGAPRKTAARTAVNGDQSDNAAPAAGAAYVFVRSGDDLDAAGLSQSLQHRGG